MDALYLIERDHGRAGYEGSFYREWTRGNVVHLCAFEFRNENGNSDVFRVYEAREDDGTFCNITEDILREAEAMRADYHRIEAIRKSFWQHEHA